MDALPSGFYVYELIDPRTDWVFYVGKGQGRRAWQHEQAVRRGDLSKNARKSAVISEIIGYPDLSVETTV